ncbi:flavoprotein [Micromonospora sp. NBC_01813]|uniref:flavoprotein n=1 Tax=Micromonospora sp. NBC_01813 TaxID=2975988 RepID=UPI002DDB10D4|nr:flavoprotein [Micromonospora sp. NBC_01813]WSA11339.1 NAD(P)-binding domain-containing protein [Micromonospora sp. NBC_01813]
MSIEYATRQLPVVVIGAGPVGLAAAAHLTGCGVPPLVLEAGAAAGAAIGNWRHVRLFSSWRDNVDPVAARLLDTAGWAAPDPTHRPTGAELIEEYLLPLAKLPPLADRIRYRARVDGITRLGLDRTRGAGRDAAPFVVRLADGTEHLARAVVDASGTWHNPNHLGGEGLPAIGETSATAYLDFALPDVLGADRAAHASRHTVVVGAGHSAANTLLDLVELAAQQPGTRITWAVRRTRVDPVFAPGDSDALPARGAIGTRLRQLIDDGQITLESGFVTHRVTVLPSSRTAATGPAVRLSTRDGRAVVADRVVVATGFRADHRIGAELRLDVDPVLGASRGLATLLDPDLPRSWSAPPHGVTELRHPEPGYFVVGIKSYGRASAFLMATGYRQVRQVAAQLAGTTAATRPARCHPTVPVATGVAGRTAADHRPSPVAVFR